MNNGMLQAEKRLLEEDVKRWKNRNQVSHPSGVAQNIIKHTFVVEHEMNVFIIKMLYFSDYKAP